MELQDYLIGCTVRVGEGDRQGAGFFVAPGLIVTAAHLVEDPGESDFPLSEVRVRGNDWEARARVAGYAASPEPDLAVLEVASTESPAAYIYAPSLPDDPLSVCGPGPDPGASQALAIASSVTDGDLRHLEGTLGAELEGAPVLDLRSGGVVAVVVRGGGTGAPTLRPRAVSVAVLARLFPDVCRRHDAYHVQSPGWFAASGVRGTVFAAREHILATRDTCETPIQPLVTPRNGRAPMELLGPVAFQSLGAGVAGPRLEGTIDAIIEGSWSMGRSVLLTGPTGSGRSSVLRALGYRAAAGFGNLGSLGGSPLFPILLRANQLATDHRPVEETIIAAMEKGNEVMTGIDLPPEFLSDLARSPRIRLVLMIDGMDEIQDNRDIAELVGLIGKIQDAPGFGRRTQMLVTARPSAAEHFRYARFDVCEIQPLSQESIRHAAGQWLGPSAARFLESNGELVRSGLLASPLVLSVALKLYESDPRRLPSQVVELYRTLISSLARERRDELAGKYGSAVADNAVDLLGFIALELLRSATVMDEAWVKTTAARYFEEHLGLPVAESGERAASFTHFAAADSHFIGPAGSRFFWSHLSFRDYFAASCLLELGESDGRALVEIRRRWFDSNWGRTPSFALQLLGDEALRLQIVEEILRSDRPARFGFLTELLREGAPLPAEMIRTFVGQLADEIRREADSTAGSEALGEPVASDLLLSLSHIPEAREALDQLGVGLGA